MTAIGFSSEMKTETTSHMNVRTRKNDFIKAYKSKYQVTMFQLSALNLLLPENSLTRLLGDSIWVTATDRVNRERLPPPPTNG